MAFLFLLISINADVCSKTNDNTNESYGSFNLMLSRQSQFSIGCTQSKLNCRPFKYRTRWIIGRFLTINTRLDTALRYVWSCCTVNYALRSIRSLFTIDDFTLFILRSFSTVYSSTVRNLYNTRCSVEDDCSVCVSSL